MSRQRKRRSRSPSQNIWQISRTISHLLVGPDLKEVLLWLMEPIATPKEWLDLPVPRQAARTAWKPCLEKTRGLSKVSSRRKAQGPPDWASINEIQISYMCSIVDLLRKSGEADVRRTYAKCSIAYNFFQGWSTQRWKSTKRSNRVFSSILVFAHFTNYVLRIWDYALCRTIKFNSQKRKTQLRLSWVELSQRCSLPAGRIGEPTRSLWHEIQKTLGGCERRSRCPTGAGVIRHPIPWTIKRMSVFMCYTLSGHRLAGLPAA